MNIGDGHRIDEGSWSSAMKSTVFCDIRI
jgi:hypothetical protein